MNCSTFGKICLVAAVPLCLSASVVQAEGFEMLSIKKQTSHYMNMGQLITRIAVGDPKIATVVQLPGSATEFLIVTKEVDGSTALFVWTQDGVRHEYMIVISPEDPGRAMLIEQAIGLPDVHVKMVADRILLTGTVENQYQKNYALQTARLFVNGNTESSLLVGSGFDMKLDVQSSKGSSSEDMESDKSENKGKIIDLIQILNPTQIRLEAQIIEINSDDAKDLGIQYGTNGNGGIFYFGEDYARTNTSITETNSYGNSNSYSGGSSNSYNGSNSNSYSNARNFGEGSYPDAYNYDYSTVTENNGYSNSYSNGNNGSYSNGFNSAFNRSVTSTWYDMVRFSNNPLKWIGQHFSSINATITALVTKGKAKILSRPSVMTLSGEQATIQIGRRIPYSTSSAYGTNIELVDIGIILQFKPIVDAQNKISSMVHTEVSALNGETSTGQPIIATRRADSVVNLQSGSSIIIGGLMDSSESKNVSKIPLLGDIPIIGEFFKHTSTSRDKRELIIVVTPHIVGEDDSSQSPISDAMHEWLYREQQYRDTMKNFDFNNPNFDDVAKDKNKRKKPKDTNAPFK